MQKRPVEKAAEVKAAVKATETKAVVKAEEVKAEAKEVVAKKAENLTEKMYGAITSFKEKYTMIQPNREQLLMSIKI